MIILFSNPALQMLAIDLLLRFVPGLEKNNRTY